MSCAFKSEKKKSPGDDSRSPISSSGYQLPDATLAVELSYLKGISWSLENRCKREKKSSKNLTDSVKALAKEKYELIEELTRQNRLCQQIYEELEQERASNAVLMNEIDGLREEADKNREALDKAMTQNVELKQSILNTNETIHQVGQKYLKLMEKTQ